MGSDLRTLVKQSPQTLNSVGKKHNMAGFGAGFLEASQETRLLNDLQHFWVSLKKPYGLFDTSQTTYPGVCGGDAERRQDKGQQLQQEARMRTLPNRTAGVVVFSRRTLFPTSDLDTQ